MFTLAVVVISTAQAVRQLWMVDLLHGLAERVNLFRVRPFYAFSGLAARTGISFLVLAYFIAAMRPDIVQDTPALQVLIIAMVPTAVACFVLPLYGMHLRLVAEKDRLLLRGAGTWSSLRRWRPSHAPVAHRHEIASGAEPLAAARARGEQSSLREWRSGWVSAARWTVGPGTAGDAAVRTPHR